MNYKKLDWPSIPEDMIVDLMYYSKEAPIIGGRDAAFDSDKQAKYPVYSILEVPKYFKDWVLSSLPDIDSIYIVGLQRFVGVPAIPIHVDSIRSFAYNNVLTTDNTITCFYDNNKNLIQHVKYDRNIWYYHNASVPHNITNLNTGFRLAATIFKLDSSRLGEDYALSSEAMAFMKGMQ